MKMKRLALSLLLLVGVGVGAATISRITTFTDGTILFASDLNAEFNNIINAINGGLDNDNLAANANIAPTKISTVIDGDGIARNPSTGALSVNPDQVTLTVASDLVKIKDGGVATLQISTQAVTTEKLALGSVTTQILANNSVTNEKLGLASVTTQNLALNAVGALNMVDVISTGATALENQVAVSPSSGSFSTTSTSFVDVGSVSVTIVATGRPMLVTLMADGGATAGGLQANHGVARATCYFRITDASTFERNYFISAEGGTLSTPFPGSELFVTTPQTYLFKLQARSESVGAGAGTTCFVYNARLVAFEL